MGGALTGSGGARSSTIRSPTFCKFLRSSSLVLRVRIYGLKREGGELFKGGFRKLFELEQNTLNETQSEIQLAKI